MSVETESDSNGDNKSRSRGEHPAIDPFLTEPIALKRIADRSPAWGLVLIPAFALLLLLANVMQGTLGPFPNGDGLKDVAYAMHFVDAPPESMTYPLTRDIVSAVLFLLVVLTVVVVHLQWQRMKAAVPKLLESRAFIGDPEGDSSAEHQPDMTRIRALVDDTNARLKSVGDLSGVALIVALGAMAGIVFGLRTVGVFRILAPRDAVASAQADFANALYQNWWASLDNVPGLFVYGLIGIVGIYIIVLQNVVGYYMVRFVIRLARDDVRLGIDPYNRDGVAGWAGVSGVLATVYVSLIMHALGLSLIVFIIGFEGVAWIAGLLLLWIVVTPIYVFVPLVIFRRRIGRAKEEAIQVYLDRADGNLAKQDDWSTAREAMVMSGVASLRSLPDLPLSVSQRVTSVLVILLPVGVSAIELWLAIGR